MTHLFAPEAGHVIDEIVGRSPLLALDFDGTLAPIVALPEQARAPMAISHTLARIAEYLPVAIVTGRSVADVSDRLGFVPRYIVGNHGAEGLPDSGGVEGKQPVDQWRNALEHQFASKLKAAGIAIEDKGHSLSLHYRLARDRAGALDVIRSTVAALTPAPRVIEGKCVTNLLPHDAPDKFHAVAKLAQLAHCDTVIFAGDDVTDDVVFEQAPQSWLTVRIEAPDHHRARFHLNHQNEVALFLQHLLRSLEQRRQAADLIDHHKEGSTG